MIECLTSNPHTSSKRLGLRRMIDENVKVQFNKFVVVCILRERGGYKIKAC